MIYTNALNGVVVGNLVGKPWDMGLIPRSPICLSIFSCNVIRYSTHQEFHQTSSVEACHASQEIHLMVRSLSPLCILSQPGAYKPERSTWPSCYWAKSLLNIPPKLGLPPLLFASLSLFFSFLF